MIVLGATSCLQWTLVEWGGGVKVLNINIPNLLFAVEVLLIIRKFRIRGSDSDDNRHSYLLVNVIKVPSSSL